MTNHWTKPRARLLSAPRWLIALLIAPPLFAAPYLPDSDDQVIQRLPSYTVSSRPPARLVDGLERASNLLTQAKSFGDPRAASLALSALAPWSEENTPALNIARAGIFQYQHRFEDALAQLAAAINTTHPDPNALLMRANIHVVQGRYPEAAADCRALLTKAAIEVSATCQAIVNSLSGQLQTSYQLLTKQLNLDTQPAEIRHWVASSAAEMAIRLGINPNSHWDEALENLPKHLPTLIEKARWQIENNAKEDAIKTLGQLPATLSRDVLLARASDNADLAALESRLSLAELADGEHAHSREYAEFLLFAAKKPHEAAEKALTNWQHQREPIDLLLLSIAATQSNHAKALQVVEEFLGQTQIEDARLLTIGSDS